MTGLENIGLLTAFIGGLVSFFSPCTLPLVPGYLSFIGGQAGQGDRVWRLLVTGVMSRMASWMLKLFPATGSLG